MIGRFTTAGDAGELHRRSIVIDALNMSRWGDDEVYQHLHEGGITAVNATVAVWEGAREAFEAIAAMYQDYRNYDKLIRPVETIDDIRAAKREGRVGIILGFQNTSPLEGDLRLIAAFHRLGVRIIQLAYNDLNYVGAGCMEEGDAGLSAFGVEVVAELNSHGIVIDLAHVGERTSLETIERSAAPCLFSHANPRALKPHPRNKSDAEAKALAEHGGVIGANVSPPYLPNGYESTLDDVVRVIDHWVNLVGVDHVAVGLDFTEGQTDQWFHWIFAGKRREPVVPEAHLPAWMPSGLERADKAPNLTAALIDGGYHREDVQKILGGNLFRLFGEVWRSR